MLATKSWTEFDFDLEALVHCVAYSSSEEPRYSSYLLYTYCLDPKVVIYSEQRGKREEICHDLFESRGQISCRHLGMIQQKGHDHCFNLELCAEILIQHIIVDTIRAISAHAENKLLRLSTNSLEEIHNSISSSSANPIDRVYLLTLETARELCLPQDDNHVFRVGPLLKLYRYKQPPCRLLIINQTKLQAEMREQLLDMLPIGNLVMLLPNQLPQHLHAEPEVKVSLTETGTEYAVSLTWKGIYMMEHPSLWVERMHTI